MGERVEVGQIVEVVPTKGIDASAVPYLCLGKPRSHRGHLLSDA